MNFRTGSRSHRSRLVTLTGVALVSLAGLRASAQSVARPGVLAGEHTAVPWQPEPARHGWGPCTEIVAREAFERGVSDIAQGRWASAAEAFEHSYRCSPR